MRIDKTFSVDQVFRKNMSGRQSSQTVTAIILYLGISRSTAFSFHEFGFMAVQTCMTQTIK
jgi:hypothetical protein